MHYKLAPKLRAYLASPQLTFAKDDTSCSAAVPADPEPREPGPDQPGGGGAGAGAGAGTGAGAGAGAGETGGGAAGGAGAGGAATNQTGVFCVYNGFGFIFTFPRIWKHTSTGEPNNNEREWKCEANCGNCALDICSCSFDLRTLIGKVLKNS